MAIDTKTNNILHERLPINDDEVILNVFKHHWFAYASIWFVSIVLSVALFAFADLATNDNIGGLSDYRVPVIIGAGALSCLIIAFTFIPIWLRSQEKLVLTEEAVLQLLQPSLFASKVSQLNLIHVADVTVNKDFFGTIFGFGRVVIETPGEQDNYIFTVLADPHHAAKSIIEAHENFQAAIESGRMPSTLRSLTPQAAATPSIDPEQYQQFLQYQQMVKQQQTTAAQSPQPQPQTQQTQAQTDGDAQSPSGPNQTPPSGQSQF